MEVHIPMAYVVQSEIHNAIQVSHELSSPSLCFFLHEKKVHIFCQSPAHSRDKGHRNTYTPLNRGDQVFCN